jgi:hypothetical protein
MPTSAPTARCSTERADGATSSYRPGIWDRPVGICPVMNDALLCAICREPGHLGEAHYDGHALIATALAVLMIADQPAVVALLLGAYALLFVVVYLTGEPSPTAARR